MLKIERNELLGLLPLYESQGLEESLTKAVIKGNVNGWAYVDDIARATMALVIQAHAGLAFWLGALPGDDDAKAFVEQLFAYKSDRDFCTWMEFENCPENMARLIAERVPNAHRTGRVCFVHDIEIFKSTPRPDPCEGISIYLYREGDELPEEAKMVSGEFWDDENDITRNSVAAVARDTEGKLCGMCISAAVVDSCWEIDISTSEKYRKKGVGYAMAHAYITECLSRGCVPGWNCRRDNAASYNLALKLGFKPTNDYDLIAWNRQDEKLIEANYNPAQDLE